MQNSKLSKLLIDNNFFIPQKYKQDLLNLFIDQNNKPYCMQLLDRGAISSDPSSNGQIPLIKAANMWNYDLCKLLLNKGAQLPEEYKKNPRLLIILAQNQDIPLCKKIIGMGAEPGALSSNKDIPLIVAVYPGNIELCKLLLTHSLFYPEVKKIKTSQESVMSGIVCLTQLEVVPDIQRTILLANKELRQDIETILLQRFYDNKTLPAWAQKIVISKIYLYTIKQLKPHLKSASNSLYSSVLKDDKKQILKEMLDPDTLEEQYGTELLKIIKAKVIQCVVQEPKKVNQPTAEKKK